MAFFLVGIFAIRIVYGGCLRFRAFIVMNSGCVGRFHPKSKENFALQIYHLILKQPMGGRHGTLQKCRMSEAKTVTAPNITITIHTGHWQNYNFNFEILETIVIHIVVVRYAFRFHNSNIEAAENVQHIWSFFMSQTGR